MTTKTKTNYREKYLALKRQNADRFLNESPLQDGEKLYTVTTPSGMEWECRRPNLKLFSDAGLLPANLASKLYLASQGGGSMSSTVNNLTLHEQAQCIEFNAAMVRYICVNPRIVETPEADNEIGFDEVTQGDFDVLTQWAIKGGEEAARLENFPGGRQPGAAVGANGKSTTSGSKRDLADQG